MATTTTTTVLDRTLTLILAGGQGSRLYPLTSNRPKPAIPFGGIFRIIDFTLSNALNSGLRRLVLLTQYKHEELHRYVREGWGALWNDFRWDRGEYLLCLPPASGKRYRGTADAVLQNIELIRRELPEFVLILSGDHVYHMDYRELLEAHADSSAGLTIAAVEQPIEEAGRFGVLEAGAGGNVIGFQEKPTIPRAMPSDSKKVLASMGVYVFNTAVLLRILSENAESNYDFGKHVIPSLIGALPVRAHELRDSITGSPGYWKDIGTIESYYHASMDLTASNPPFDPYSNDRWPTRTKGPRGLHPCRPSSRVSGQVTNSVISAGVQILADSSVEDSVLMRGARIGNGSRVRRAIVEEGVEIPADVEIGYDRPEDLHRYMVTESGIVVVTGRNLESRPVEHPAFGRFAATAAG